MVIFLLIIFIVKATWSQQREIWEFVKPGKCFLGIFDSEADFIRQIIIRIVWVLEACQFAPMPCPCPVWKTITVCPSSPRATVGKGSRPAILLALTEEGWATTLSYTGPAVGFKLSDSLVIQNMSKLPHSHQPSQWVRAYLPSPTDGQSLTYSRLCVKVTTKSHESLSPAIVPHLTEESLKKDFYF